MKQSSMVPINAQPYIAKDELEPNDDWSATFKSEIDATAESPKAKQEVSAGKRAAMHWLPVVVLGAAVVLAGGWFAWQAWAAVPRSRALPLVVADGTAVFNSVPEGASIAIDGTPRGVTPLRLSLATGAHNAEITSGTASRTLPIIIEPGGVISHYVEFAPAPVALGGRIEISSDRPGAQVMLDGVPKGVTPVVIPDVAPGQHRVTVSTGDTTVNRIVNVTRGTTATLVISAAPSATGASGGWLTVQTPIDMEILQGGLMLGNTRMERVMLPIGSHRIEFANAGLEVSVVQTVQIAAGKTVNVAIALPSGRLSVNAVPWADVFLDGVAVGTTPLGDLTVPIGPHELVFRHPQFGERRQSVVVKAQTPARIGIDLRK